MIVPSGKGLAGEFCRYSRLFSFELQSPHEQEPLLLALGDRHWPLFAAAVRAVVRTGLLVRFALV